MTMISWAHPLPIIKEDILLLILRNIPSSESRKDPQNPVVGTHAADMEPSLCPCGDLRGLAVRIAHRAHRLSGEFLYWNISHSWWSACPDLWSMAGFVLCVLTGTVWVGWWGHKPARSKVDNTVNPQCICMSVYVYLYSILGQHHLSPQQETHFLGLLLNQTWVCYWHLVVVKESITFIARHQARRTGS